MDATSETESGPDLKRWVSARPASDAHQVKLVAILDKVVDRDDCRGLQRGDGLGFPLKTNTKVGIVQKLLR